MTSAISIAVPSIFTDSHCGVQESLKSTVVSAGADVALALTVGAGAGSVGSALGALAVGTETGPVEAASGGAFRYFTAHCAHAAEQRDRGKSNDERNDFVL
jgi:hypothetical protein